MTLRRISRLWLGSSVIECVRDSCCSWHARQAGPVSPFLPCVYTAEVPSQWYCHGEHAYTSCRLRLVSDFSDIAGGFKERLIDAA